MTMRNLLKIFEAEPASAPVVTTNPSAPGYNTGKTGPAKIGTQSFGAPVGGGAKPAAKPAAPNYGAAVKSANAAFAANQAKAPQGDQTAGGKTNASFLPGAAGGAKPATAAPAASTTPAPQTNALGIAPQANIQGSPTGSAAEPKPTPQTNAFGIAPQANIQGSPTGPAAEPKPTPQTNAFGIAPQANIQGSPTGSAAEPTPAPQANALGISPQANASNPFGTTPASQAAKPTTPVGLGSAAVTPDMATASKPASVNPPTQGGPAVTGGFGQETNISSRAFEEDLDEADELSEIMRLSGQPMQEKAPPGAKAERMVKHIKKGYAKDGKLTDKEKGIAYATAWKAHNKDKVSESVMLEAGSTLEHIIKKFKHETKNFLAGNDLDNDLYDALYDYYSDNGEIPYGVAKARDGDPYQWISNKFADEMQMHGYGRQADMLNMPGADHELTELARLAGLSESQVAECGDMVTGGEEDSMNVSTNMDSEGSKSVTISARGNKADELLQMLKMAGMGPHDDHDEDHEEVVMVVPDHEEEMMDEERVSNYANTPEEEYETVSAITRQGNDLNREKRQYADQPKLGDNPMAEDVMLDEELQDLLDSILFREEMTDVLKAEQPYRDEKTGKMVTPPKGATMPPADSPPPAPKTNVKK